MSTGNTMQQWVARRQIFGTSLAICPKFHHARIELNRQWPKVYDLCHTFLHVDRVFV